MKHKAGDIIKCKRKGCPGTFLFNPKQKYQKYCSPACSEEMNRQRQRKRYFLRRFARLGTDKYGMFWSNLLNDKESFSGIRKFQNDEDYPMYDQQCYIAPRRSQIHVSGN